VNVVTTSDSAAGGQQRRAHPLKRSERDQLARGGRDPVQQRGHGEQDHPGHEHPTPAEPIGQSPAEQQQTAKRDRVGGDHVLQVRCREVQVGLDRRQRHVHDRPVEDYDELRHHQQRQRVPATPTAGLV
jgi:hypothetical protein